ncbi:MAG TPA: LysR family transcriptional regulator [Acetobacteraceae bacterium]|nr:LysR family transcriptional regulator [Acetobacteraceae bacterium]
MNVNLKLLHTFLLVAEHNSFRRAAEESHRSQSAVSMQIRQLELQLEVSLFHRTTRRVQLTSAGEVLLDCARKAMLEMQVGLRQIKEAVDIHRGRLALACAPTIAATRLPAILAAFQKAYPSVTAQVRELTAAEMLECLRRQEVDFGIGPRVAGAAEFHFRPLLVDEIYALIPGTIEVGQRDAISFSELCRIPTLVMAGSPAMQVMLEEAQKSAGVALSVKYEVRQIQTQIAMAAAGLGAAILPRIALPGALDPRLRAVPIINPSLSRELCVITIPGQSVHPVASRFLELLHRLIAEPPAADGPGTLVRRRHLALASSQVG